MKDKTDKKLGEKRKKKLLRLFKCEFFMGIVGSDVPSFAILQRTT